MKLAIVGHGRPRLRHRALPLFLVGLALGPADAGAVPIPPPTGAEPAPVLDTVLGDGGPAWVRGDTIDVASNPLEAASLAFARALLDNSGSAFGTLLAAGGVRLQLGGGAHSGLSSRQAAATLREFLQGHEGARSAVTQAAPVAGSPDRGFAEVHWTARMAGTSQAVRRVLFVGLVQASGEWRVDEVRLMP